MKGCQVFVPWWLLLSLNEEKDVRETRPLYRMVHSSSFIESVPKSVSGLRPRDCNLESASQASVHDMSINYFSFL